MSIIQSYGGRIGDRITFRSPTRWSCVKATRKVNGFWKLYADDKCTVIAHWPTVRYGGYAEFIVRPHEIISIEEGRS